METISRKEYYGLNMIVWAFVHMCKYRSRKDERYYKIKEISFESKSEEISDNGIVISPSIYELMLSKIIKVGMKISRKDRVHCSIEA